MIRKPFELREMLASIETLVPAQRRDARGQSA
jgi:hypothetical protein